MAMHILIVDADSGAAAATRAFVQHLVPSASVVCEVTPERAWSAAHQTPPDVLLIDPAPDATGSTLLIQLCNELWPAMRVIVLASAPVAPSRRQQYHADVCLEKPTSPTHVLDALTRVLAATESAVPSDAPSLECRTGEPVG